MELGLADKRILITGGSKGIGLATAHAFAAEGCELHLCARTIHDLEAARDAIRQRHDVPVSIHPHDLSLGDAVLQLLSECGDLDVLVNNAGAIPGGSLTELDEASWRAAWDLKVFGYINAMRAALSMMQGRESGVIINVIGNAGDQPPAEYAAGISANAMLATLTRTVGSNSLDHGIRVVGVSPGDLMNERGERFLRRQAERELGDPERWRERLDALPGGRAGTSDEIADTIVFLASERASYISGTVLTVDGGVSARRAVL